MNVRALRRVVAGLGLIVGMSAAPAHALVIGVADTSNVYPFNADIGTRYQQVYDAGSFAGPLLISSISFFNARRPDATFSTGDYTFTLSTSNNPVNTLDTADLDANPGADAALFASLNLSGATGPQLDIFAGTGGGAAFAYDPANGDLLIDIVRSNSTGGGSGAFDAMNGTSGGLFSRAHDFGGGFSGYGLVTGFNESKPPSVPEPATTLLLVLGLAGIGFARARG